MNPPAFTSAHGRALIVKILLIVNAVASGIAILIDGFSFAFPPTPNEQEFGGAMVSAVTLLAISLVALFQTLVYWTTVVVFCMWLYRAHKNLRALDPWSHLGHSAGWSVGSFFVPFVNLFVPYQAVKEVWQKSRLPEDAFLFETPPPASFPIWWMFWLLASFVGKLSFRASIREGEVESSTIMLALLGDALVIAAAIFAYKVVDGIDKRQEEASMKAKLGKYAVPPPPPNNLPLPDVTVPTS